MSADLWSGDHHCSIQLDLLELLNYCDVFITGAWGRVYDQIVSVSPYHVCKELLDHGCTHSIPINTMADTVMSVIIIIIIITIIIIIIIIITIITKNNTNNNMNNNNIIIIIVRAT